MQKLRTIWRHLFDVRPGELGRTIPMFFYLLLVMFAYYILKPVSRAMFLNKFEIDKLPWLYILIAVFGGILAYLYSKLAAKTSLSTAVFWSMLLSVICLVAIWYLLSIKVPGPEEDTMVPKLQWMIYVFNVWVSLFSVVLVSQGWLVASNMFTPREAKRLYGLLGVALVIGAWSGGEFTNQVVRRVGTDNLLPVAAVLVVLAYAAFRVAAAQKGVSLAAARASEKEEADFSLQDMVSDVVRTKHLQVIVGIMVMMFIVDSLVDFQLQAMAKGAFKGDQLTAFLGRFYGTYLNVAEFIFQFFLTTLIVGRFGVGGTMQVMPVAILLSSLGTAFAPGVVSASIARLTEASTRYTLNRTGLELLYMPLPLELRNRVKAFIDIFVDRFSRGVGGILLLLLFTVAGSHADVAQIVRIVAIVAIALTFPWMLLSQRARKEYLATIQRRLATRQLDLASARVTVEGAETVALLEQTAAGRIPRQAAYALSLLGECPSYDLPPLLEKLVTSPHAEVRAKVYELARSRALASLVKQALAEIQTGDAAVIPAALAYTQAVSPESAGLLREWVDRAAADPQAGRRALAAQALGIVGEQGPGALQSLLNDPDSAVVSAACRAAGALGNRAYFHALVHLLPNPHVRWAAVAALAAYGPRITGSLGDMLEDHGVDAKIRRQIPRVLKQIPDQHSVEVLLKATLQHDAQIRDAALKALNRLRTTAAHLHFERGFVTPQIMTEARTYFELRAALAPVGNFPDRPHTRLLARSIEERLRKTLDRVFRLLALQYPPKEIYAAWLAVDHKRAVEISAALEFLDNVVDREVKRVLMPLVEAPANMAQRGKELFGVGSLTAEAAIQELVQSGDPWLAPCARAAAAEFKAAGGAWA